MSDNTPQSIIQIAAAVKGVRQELQERRAKQSSCGTEEEQELIPPAPIVPPQSSTPLIEAEEEPVRVTLYHFVLGWCGYAGVFTWYGYFLHWAGGISWLRLVSQFLCFATFSPILFGIGGISFFVRYKFFRPNVGRIELLMQVLTAYTAASGLLSLFGFDP